MPEAVLVSAVRTPVGRAPKGALSTTRPDDLAAIALNGALQRIPALDKAEVDDVILGCAQPEGEQGWNAFQPCSPSGCAQPRMTSSTSALSSAGIRCRAPFNAIAARSSGRVVERAPLGARPT